MSFRAETCPSCRRDIQVPSDIPRPTCPYCQADVPHASVISAATVSTLMGMAKSAALAGNNVEALAYFNRVLEVDPRNSEAWIGKGKAAAWQTTLANFRVGEMLVAFNHAIANADPAVKVETIQSAVVDANHLIVTIYTMARNHMLEYVSLPNSWSDYLGQMGQMLDALETVNTWSPLEKLTLENIVHICKDNIEGVSYRDQFNNNVPKAWTLSPQYEATLKIRMDDAANRLLVVDPSYVPPKIEKKKAADCFVITATMRNPLHPDVIYLQKFRDSWMRQRTWAIVLIKLYYRHGPRMAAFIDGSDTRRTLSYFLVVRPAVFIASLLNRIDSR